MTHIPFNKPYMSNKELEYIKQAHTNSVLAGDGPFTKKCHQWLESHTGCVKALLTHSCTAALEMSAILLDIQEGDEIIMPSFTFVSTANAFVLRGGVPVFIDIRNDTLNIDEKLIEESITDKTKAIVVVHYAGVPCEMDTIMKIAKKYDLAVIEDAAQGILSKYKNRPLGSIGHLSAYSFHETKNIISGEGGALLINDPKFSHRAEIIREKGTNRSSFFRGETNLYTWHDLGSSFLPGELIAAFLWAQLEQADSITSSRIQIWNNYHKLFENAENKELLSRPFIPKNCTHNAHIYFLVVKSNKCRNKLISRLKSLNIHSLFHYIPLHSSPAGQRFGRSNGELNETTNLSSRLVRLPMWIGLSNQEQEYVATEIINFLESYTSE